MSRYIIYNIQNNVFVNYKLNEDDEYKWCWGDSINCIFLQFDLQVMYSISMNKPSYSKAYIVFCNTCLNLIDEVGIDNVRFIPVDDCDKIYYSDAFKLEDYE